MYVPGAHVRGLAVPSGQKWPIQQTLPEKKKKEKTHVLKYYAVTCWKLNKDKTLCWNISLETWHQKNYFYFAPTHFLEKNDMVDFSDRLSEITMKLKVPKSQFVYGIMLDHKAYQCPQQQQKSAHKPKKKLGAWILIDMELEATRPTYKVTLIGSHRDT